MGISKRELMNDYYYDELLAVMSEYGVLHGAESLEESEPKPCDVRAFLSM